MLEGILSVGRVGLCMCATTVAGHRCNYCFPVSSRVARWSTNNSDLSAAHSQLSTFMHQKMMRIVLFAVSWVFLLISVDHRFTAVTAVVVNDFSIVDIGLGDTPVVILNYSTLRTDWQNCLTKSFAVLGVDRLLPEALLGIRATLVDHAYHEAIVSSSFSTQTSVTGKHSSANSSLFDTCRICPAIEKDLDSWKRAFNSVAEVNSESHHQFETPSSDALQEYLKLNWTTSKIIRTLLHDVPWNEHDDLFYASRSNWHEHGPYGQSRLNFVRSRGQRLPVMQALRPNRETRLPLFLREQMPGFVVYQTKNTSTGGTTAMALLHKAFLNLGFKSQLCNDSNADSDNCRRPSGKPYLIAFSISNVVSHTYTHKLSLFFFYYYYYIYIIGSVCVVLSGRRSSGGDWRVVSRGDGRLPQRTTLCASSISISRSGNTVLFGISCWKRYLSVGVLLFTVLLTL
jgi:hypothetical protein